MRRARGREEGAERAENARRLDAQHSAAQSALRHVAHARVLRTRRTLKRPQCWRDQARSLDTKTHSAYPRIRHDARSFFL